MDQLSIDFASRRAPRRRYSAADLVRYTECEHAAAIELGLVASHAEPLARDAQAQMVAAKGDAWEQHWLAGLQRDGIEVRRLERPRGTSIDARAAETRAALAEGAPVIYQATLADGAWYGVADFLRRVERPSALGDYSYEVLDTKLARSDRPKFLVQLCLYSSLLGQLQQRVPQQMHVVLGDGSQKTYRFEDFQHYFAGIRARFEGFLHGQPAYPLPCELCELCRWRPSCELRWLQDDHLCRVANIRRDQMRKLEAAGVSTLADLARLPPERPVRRLGHEARARLQRQAAMQLAGRESATPCIELLPLVPGEPRGFNRLPRPDGADLYFDMEGDPFYPDGLEYLFGVHWCDVARGHYRAYWGHDHGAERRAFEAFVDFACDWLAAHPQAHIYHYAHYEETALKRLASYHGTREAEIDDWLRRDVLVDLYKIVRQAVVVSEPSYSIKHMERYYREARAGAVTDAGASIVYYEQWRESGEQPLLDEIESYNRDDCESLRGLRDWLIEQRPAQAEWWQTPTAAESRIERSDKRLREDAERDALLERLRARGSSSASPHREVLHLLGELIDFHRREDKPEWWAYFDRQEKDTEELIEDAECLAGLERIAADPEAAARGEYDYRFPPQETKLRAGKDATDAHSGKQLGTIVDIDERESRLRIASRTEPAGRLDLGPQRPIPSNPLRLAVARFAESCLADSAGAGALYALLARRPPQLRGRAPGEALARASDVEAVIDAALSLEDSYLFIQGPPGAGKTYIGSALICALLAQGHRVGVTANSHKAIHHLLDTVEQEARRRGLEFSGMKKANSRDKDTEYWSEYFRSGGTNRDIVGCAADLVAGTAWLFADPGLAGRFDYLFVEEAGQVSLANVVAMGSSARNLIFLGDQMQLAQPLKGVHPGRSGESILEFLLDGEAVIDAARGIFLDTTWRLHPSLCAFISAAVYEGRLQPRPENAHQALLLDGSAHADVRESGLVFVELPHEGNSQGSPEEAAYVAQVYAGLLGQQFRDKRGDVATISHENIRVVTPYNVQVNELRRTLPGEARVGTVDKFQGQEAEVVIISMATSSAEELPRDIEFLYSRNRLNVAISRARILAVLIASPQLLAIPCRTVEQMQLVNTLCWARAHAHSSAN